MCGRTTCLAALFTFTLLIAGCTSGVSVATSSSVPTNRSPATFVASVTVSASPAQKVTNTPQKVETITPTPSTAAALTPTPTVRAFSLVQRCDGSHIRVDDARILPGQIVYGFLSTPSRGLWSTNSSFAYGRQIATLGSTSKVVASPDGDRLLIGPPRTSGALATVLSPDGKINFDFTWPGSWPTILSVNWIDEARLSYYTDDSVFLLTPNTHPISQQLSLPSLPDLMHIRGGSFAVNSLLTRVAYATHDFGLAMRQLPNGEAVATYHFQISQSTAPFRWSPDGTALAVMAQDPSDPSFRSDELFIFDESGQGGRVSNLSQYFDRFGPLSMDWSRNGRFIAIWAKATPKGQLAPNDEYRLFLFDLANQVVTDYCLTNSTAQHKVTYIGATWSPDSAQLYVLMHDDTPGIILDLSSGNVLELPSDIYIAAWSKS